MAIMLGEFILGEFRRTLDERYRLSLPAELLENFGAKARDLVLAKERPGCLSLWVAANWQARLDPRIDLLKAKMRAGRLEGDWGRVQSLGRLLSTRHTHVQLAGRGRLIVPEGFREFLKVEANNDVMLVGAAVCIEVWQPMAWLSYLDARMPQFGRLFDKLSQ
jgi:MraZ protein